MKEYAAKVKAGYPFASGEFKATPKIIIKIVIIGLLAGFGAGSLGIGMGIVLTPVYISIGLDTPVASATTMYIGVYSTSAASIVVCIVGRLNYEYAANIIILTILGTFPGLYL
jgi:uncharacterized membrane protein YfcA